MRMTEGSSKRLLSYCISDSMGNPVRELSRSVSDLAAVKSKILLPDKRESSSEVSSLNDMQVAVTQLSAMIGCGLREGTTDTDSNNGDKQEVKDCVSCLSSDSFGSALGLIRDSVPMLCSSQRAEWTVDPALTSNTTIVPALDLFSGTLLSVLSYTAMNATALSIDLKFEQFSVLNSKGSGLKDDSLNQMVYKTESRFGELRVSLSAEGVDMAHAASSSIQRDMTIRTNDKKHSRDFFIKLTPVSDIFAQSGGSSSLGVETRNGTETLVYNITVPCRIEAECSVTEYTPPVPSCHAAQSETESATPLAKDNLNVLIVDDSPATRKILGRWLSRNRCTVKQAENGLLGVNALKNNDVPFDIVFMDFLMPVMDGIEAMNTFNEWKQASPDAAAKYSNTMVVGLSATADQTDRERGFAVGMDFFIQKPANPKLLGKLVSMKLERCSISEICEACAEDED
eukprot:CAMPEP_0185030784 /NCGR_PEP_ID=MMETSP1103-20130426/17849_1 /TAXON_ID=36769 /ORGANISM="Paraphysomonas bandaiensis, Strain Caron Lab Isolate" /LENGTH=455 /DNA_ID=CAMNT_0027566041 /DNA_START=500 /DNA_END=1867 /DNA_ORIENTATION=+